jgi:uncharacterized protein YuzE
MKLRIDERAHAAYLYLRGEHEQVHVVETRTVAPPGAVHADERIGLDFDADGHLVGIEFLVPDAQLLPSVISDAERYEA